MALALTIPDILSRVEYPDENKVSTRYERWINEFFLTDEEKKARTSKLNENDELQNLLLKRLYEGDETSAIAFQVYFFCSRFDNYRKGVLNHNLSVFDRTIFEDRLFAHQNMTTDPIMFGFYDSM